MANCMTCGRQVTGGLVVCGDCAPRWVNVKERLPSEREDVLAVAFWNETYRVMMAWYATGGDVWHVNVGLGDKTDLRVTHWMPLPEPPRRDQP